MPQLSETLASIPRLKVVAFLEGCREAEFGAVTQYCDVNKSTLSKAVTVLEEAGHLTVTKGYVGRRPRTWLALTDSGRKAYHDHLAALAALARTARAHCGEEALPPHEH